MTSNFTSNSIGPDLSGVSYHLLQNVEEGSPEHEEAVKTIQAQERAAEIAFRNTLQGTGVSGHGYASYTIIPEDAVPSNEKTYLGPMGVGVASPDLREGLVRIGQMETSIEVAEAMRRGMSPQEWTILTGLPYSSLTQAQYVSPDEKAKAQAKLATVQDELDKASVVDELAKAEEDAKRIEQEEALQNVPPSILEQALENQYGPDMAQGLTRSVVESGEVDLDTLGKLGVAPEMIEETIQHYTEATERMLNPVGSCVAYTLNFLSEPEAKTLREAVVARDLSKVQSLGTRARDRAAQMSFDEVSEFLSKEERLKIKLRNVNRQPVISLPNGVTTSWASAVTQGLISFK